ncbi:hypothetical protein BH20VER1_BH20VER1_18710 [soil metagenome]
MLRPSLLLAGLVVLLCGWISLTLPLAPLVEALWMAAPILLLICVWLRGGLLVTRAGLCLGAVAVLAVWLVLANFAGRWVPLDIVSHHPDAWSYGAFADFFMHYRRGLNPPDMPKVAQFSEHLQNTRFGSTVLLAFLGAMPAVGGVAFSHLAFYALCLVVQFCGFIYFVRALSMPWWVAIGSALAGTAGGWLANVIMVGNYDSLLFIALVPAWLGLVVRFQRGAISPRKLMAAGALLLAALLQIYPEGCALLGVLLLPLAISMVQQAWSSRRDAWTFAGMGALSLVLVLPYLPIFLAFLRAQLMAGGSSRPGEGNFTGLLGPPWFPGTFAMGEELVGSSFQLTNLLLPTLFAVLMAVGTVELHRRLRWLAWVPLPLVGLVLWQGLLARYDYGFYKVLLCASWWIYPAIVIGLWRLTIRFRKAPFAHAAFVTGLVAGLAWEKWEDLPYRGRPVYSLRPLEELTRIEHTVGRAPILLDLDNDFEYLWSTLFLRSHRLTTTNFRSYYAMPHIHLRGLPSPQECPYVLTSGDHADAVWKNSRFSLLRNTAPRIALITNPNGLETLRQGTFLWIGTQQTVFTITTPEAGDYTLRARQWLPGPSLPDRTSRKVLVTDRLGSRELTLDLARGRTSDLAISLRLERGENRVTLQSLDESVVAKHPNGDTRELLLGVEAPSIGEATEPVGQRHQP